MARGRPTFIRISVLVAPSERSTSRSSGSMVASPVATFTTMGKNEIMKAVMIAGMVPMPNQITSTGTTATLGIELKPISRSEEHTYELQSLMRTSYAVFCLKQQNSQTTQHNE